MSVAFGGHVGPWTIADLEAFPSTGDHSRYELLTPGVLTVSPAPGTAHQRASLNVAVLLRAAATTGADVEFVHTITASTGEQTMIPSPFPVELDPAELLRQ